MTSRADWPPPNCPARQGASTFGVSTAEFFFDVRDSVADDREGGRTTEVVGYFRPPGSASAEPWAEPTLIAVAGLEVPAGSAISRLAWKTYTSRAGSAIVGQVMRSAITACPCSFPSADCAALDECALLRAIEQAARHTRQAGGLPRSQLSSAPARGTAPCLCQRAVRRALAGQLLRRCPPSIRSSDQKGLVRT